MAKTKRKNVRVVEAGNVFHFERRIRGEWVTILVGGEPLTALSREVAEEFLSQL